MKKVSILTSEQMKQEILLSHIRSERYGISREERSPNQKRLSPAALQKRRFVCRDLLDVVSGYIEEFYDLLSPERFMIAFVDRDGYILHLAGSDRLKAEFAERNCAPGYCWTERNVGTTAISLCLKKQVSIQLNDKEHYCIKAHGFTSCAAPIFGHEDSLQGVLVVSGSNDLVHPHTLIMVTSAARSIEKHMCLLQQNREMSFYTGFLDRVVESAETGLIAIDSDLRIWKSNRKANEILKDGHLENKPVSILKGLEIDLDHIYSQPSVWREKECNIKYGNQDIHVIFSAQPILSEKRELMGAVVVFEDVGNIRKLAERFSGTGAYFTFDHLIGQSPSFLDAISLAKKAAQSTSTVLLLGETGTGKELFAQAIHNAGACSGGPFVPINCGAIPGELMESELFGYVDGAFTGAIKGGKVGKFELAHGGTILLDEIGDMPHDMQVKLLRVLQTGEVQRIGSNKMVKVNTRIIASTHVNLEKAIEHNRFRKDLYYRLNIITIKIPRLKERGPRDIMALADYFVKKNNPVCQLSMGAMDALTAYDWPGNARELENTIQRSLHLCDSGILEEGHLGLPVKRINSTASFTGSLHEMEKRLISATLEDTSFNMALTARKLGISRATLYRKVKTHKIDMPVKN
ncbi:Sigma54 specific transcriptional regulator, Fis family [Desulfamplus magnetovallimortis]|uniref:Sigma54 specific transcriptional regulator, Fis family n=1 Tax=Desulfamplus magnetovallimortis TaxID=1246637 RepID=A0A1W1H5H6_9BACT|nr:sigma 54-interacting transcriptional regulator [Desulfamplus magnetovallimortis]SLM27733.1 Sigma54 specific transcriptional regulator, Fis family [Desulfamplus magnetovallimortis]